MNADGWVNIKTERIVVQISIFDCSTSQKRLIINFLKQGRNDKQPDKIDIISQVQSLQKTKPFLFYYIYIKKSSQNVKEMCVFLPGNE